MMDPFAPTAPHCDQAVLHAPGECGYCDRHPDWQSARLLWGIAFTGHAPGKDEVACPSDHRRGTGGAHSWPGNRPAQPTAAERLANMLKWYPRNEARRGRIVSRLFRDR